MIQTLVSALTVTGISGVIVVESFAKAFLTGFRQSNSSLSGFAIEQKSQKSFTYSQIELRSQSDAENAPDVQVSLSYKQEASYEEVDLDIAWSDVGNGAKMANASPDYRDFEIGEMALSAGTGKFGVPSFKNVPIIAEMKFKLWFEDSESVRPGTAITVTISAVVEDDSMGPIVVVERDNGPTKLLLLGKVVIKPYPES